MSVPVSPFVIGVNSEAYIGHQLCPAMTGFFPIKPESVAAKAGISPKSDKNKNYGDKNYGFD